MKFADRFKGSRASLQPATPPLVLTLTLTLALALALCAMPFTLHGDLFFVHSGPFQLVYGGVWDVYGHAASTDVARTGATYYPPLVFYGLSGFQWILKPAAWGFDAWMRQAADVAVSPDTGSMAYVLNVFKREDTWRWIFLMKLPFLAAHAALLLWIARLADSKQRSWMLTVWALNPVLFFTNYLFGQYRVLSILPALGCLVSLRKGRRDLAAALYGALLLMETYPVLLLPAVAIVCGRNARERLRFMAIALAVAAAVFVPLAIHSHGTVAFSYFSPLYAKAAARGITRHHSEIVNAVCKLILVGGAALVWFRLLAVRRKSADEHGTANRFAAAGLALLLLLLGTGQTSVHYPLWVAGFWIFLQLFGRLPWGAVVSVLFWTLPLVFNLDTRVLNLGLLEPLAPGTFIALPSLHEVMDRWVYWGGVVAGSRLLFSGVALFMAWRLWRKSLIE